VVGRRYLWGSLVGAIVLAACSAGEGPAASNTTLAALPTVVTAAPTTAAATTTTTSTTTTTTTSTTTTTTTLPPSADGRLELVTEVWGDIAPKSVVASGDGLFFAQNMMYRHTITVYDGSGNLIETIDDEVELSAYGIEGYAGTHQGSPVEAVFTADGDYAYVSNYQMYGAGFDRAGGDGCNLGEWDESFLYRVDTASLEIDQVIPVGAVPKFLAITPDDTYVLVTNWCTFDMSVVATATGREVTRVELGRHPRGIAVTGDGSKAYASVMGGSDIAVVDLADFTVEWLRGVGRSPRHLVLSPDDRFLYATLNGEGRVIKIDLATGETIGRVATGSAPRSMAISTDGQSLYVVNYNSDTLSKVLTADMTEVQELPANDKPIGITYDPETGNVWVSTYSGSLMIFSDD
jgi:YVTN family beta-propeller protein